MKNKKIILSLLLALVSFGIYINALNGDFIIDDHASLLQNLKIHNLNIYISKFFSFRIGSFIELADAVIWNFFGGSPYFFHLFSVFTHVACVISLFFLFECLFIDINLAFLASLIFAVHPIHTEVVSWISGGHYALSALFFILSFLFYVKSKKSVVNLLLCTIFFVFCFFSGNAVAVLPVIFIGYDLFFRGEADKKSAKLRMIILCAVFLVSILFVSYLFFTRNTFTRTIFYYRGFAYLIVITKAFVYYLKILYLPLQRGLFHPFAFNAVDIQKISPAFFSFFAVIVTMVVIFFKARKSMPALSFGIMWYLVNFAPYSNIIPICNIVSERYLYLPSAGFCLVLACLFLKVWEIINREPSSRRILRMAMVCALTLCLGSYTVLTLKRNYEYKNIIVYWQSNINNFPNGNFIYNNLAATFYTMGDKNNAISYSWINLLTNPDQPHVWSNLGKVYREIGEQKMALDCYKQALAIDPKFYPALKALDQINKEKNKQK